MKTSYSTLGKLIPICFFASIFAGSPLQNWLFWNFCFSRFISAIEFSWTICSLTLILIYLLLRKAEPKFKISKKALIICLFALLISGIALGKWVSIATGNPMYGYLVQFAFQVVISVAIIMVSSWLIEFPRSSE